METAWIVADPPDSATISALQAEVRLPPAFVNLLGRRGITDPEQARRFLQPSMFDLGDPRLLRDLEAAVLRLDRAIGAHEPILVHGDYDVDGTTATALVVRVLRALGAEADYFIPHRIEDGYGLSAKAIEYAQAMGARLIVTTDCGIGALEPVEQAAALGIDSIITDHHEVGDELPKAVAVVNPKRPDCTYPFKDFAGVGVAYKLLQGLLAYRGRGEEAILQEHLDLVALGTIADVVPLVGENRILAREGLKLLSKSKKPGVLALIRIAGLSGKAIESGHVAFALAPRINAAGRLGDSATSMQLLLTQDVREAAVLAEGLEKDNTDRRKLDETMLEEAMQMVEADFTGHNPQPLVFWSEDWHPGVLGIVASRLVDRYRVPAILIAIDGIEGRGSGRAIEGFDMVGVLAHCADLLEEWGGHKYAVGLKIRHEKLAAFRERFARCSQPVLSKLDMRPRLEIEEALTLESCTKELALLCEDLAPFGYENPEPVFMSRDVQLLEAPERLGDRGQHLRMTAYQEGYTRECIAFGMGEMADEIDRPGQRLSIAYVPTVNRWRGRERLQLRLKDLKIE